MGQAPDGAMIGLNKQQFDDFFKHGCTKLAMIGDVFKIRGCCFELEQVSEYGISAKGISKVEFEQKKQRML